MVKRIGVVGIVLIAVFSSAVLAHHQAATTVILVRHAEKVDESADPELSKEGQDRAAALAKVLADAGISEIYTTQFRRTNLTAEPLAKKLKIEAKVLQAGPSYAAEVAARIRKERLGKTTLVVGHSNTIGPVLRELGHATPVTLTDKDYGDIFICTIPEEGEPSVIRLHF